ncbi:MAG: class C sortase [Ruminococcaceae bacterium]|jgi:sortase A|nr:class C sortase [Oscillospiraceae bacterium]
MDEDKVLEAAKKKKKSNLSNIILSIILLMGIGIMAYPTVSDWWNSYHQSRAIASYANVVENTSTEEMEAMLEAARAYNRHILTRDSRFIMTDLEREYYEKLLDLSGTGIMGYIQINAIGVSLPVYHTTEERVLQIAIGHVDWSSLPVGGEGTHTVLSGHRGLPSARLLTDLDRLVVGDTFTITVLNNVCTYEVDQIRIVEPQDLTELEILDDKDYCTLVTCTPYGINTHRLLVRGHRIENIRDEVVVTAGGLRIPTYVVIPAVGIPLLFLFLLGMLIYYGVRPKRKTEEELLESIREAAAEELKNDETSGQETELNEEKEEDASDRSDINPIE